MDSNEILSSILQLSNEKINSECFLERVCESFSVNDVMKGLL